MSIEHETELCPWLADTFALLEKLPRKVKLGEVAAGSGVPLPWLSKFHAGKFKYPNIIYVYRLYQYLMLTGK